MKNRGPNTEPWACNWLGMFNYLTLGLELHPSLWRTQPSFIDRFKSLVIEGVILSAVAFHILPEICLWHLILRHQSWLVSRESSMLKTF